MTFFGKSVYASLGSGELGPEPAFSIGLRMQVDDELVVGLSILARLAVPVSDELLPDLVQLSARCSFGRRRDDPEVPGRCDSKRRVALEVAYRHQVSTRRKRRHIEGAANDGLVPEAASPSEALRRPVDRHFTHTMDVGSGNVG
jgi:hypothetical protein